MVFRILFTTLFILGFSQSQSAAQQPSPSPTPRPPLDIEVREQRQETEDGRFTPTGASTHGSDQKRFRVEVGILPRYNSNLFEAEDEAVKVGSYITTLSARAEYDLVRNDRRTVTGSAQVRYNIFKDVQSANSVDIDLAMRLISGSNDLQATFFTTPKRLAFITASDVFVHNSVTGLNLDYSRRLSSNFRVRGGYQVTRESYRGSLFDDRNSYRHRLTADFRYRFHTLFQPGLGVEYDRVNANSENFNRSGVGPVVLLVSSWKDIMYTSARYKFIRRDYDTDDPLLSNFDRRDFRHDFNVYTSVKLARQWRLYAFYSALESNSSRIGRSFTGYQTGIGLFFVLP